METEMGSVAKNYIFRAPLKIRYGRRSEFEPKLVSIGPYFLGREHLKEMEEFKFRCVADLMKKTLVGANDVDRVPCEPFMMCEPGARSFYINLDFDPRLFVRMLVLDSCFIIRILLSLSQEVQEMGFLEVNIKEVRSDLLLLENQIPLFFVRMVYEWLSLRTENPTFPPFETVVAPFICMDMPWSINHGGLSSGAAHLLDLYWRCSSPPRPHFENPKPSLAEIHINGPNVVVNNATVLHQISGITFEKLNIEGNHVTYFEKGLDVSFSNGILRMPCLKIDSCQITLLLNLVAYESSKLTTERTISSYMKFMDALIDSEKDVELLQQCGVIYNTLSSHKMAATFFNDIGDFCLIDNNAHLFSDLYKNVHKYYHSSWNRRWASLQHNYFNSPWAGISVVAGGTLLILSALQTFYTIYPYYNPKH